MKKQLATLLLVVLLTGMFSPSALASVFVAPAATSFSVSAIKGFSITIQLLCSDPGSNPLTYGTVAGPSNGGSLSNLNTSTGVVIYTAPSSYSGNETFTYNCTSSGGASNTATVTVNVSTATTTVIGRLVQPDGVSPRAGSVTWILTQAASGLLPGGGTGLIAAGATVSQNLDVNGQYTVSLTPTTGLSPETYYQLWFLDAHGGARQLIGVYSIPAAPSINQGGIDSNRVTDTNKAKRFRFASESELDAMLNYLSSQGAVSHNLLSATVTDTVASTATRGGVPVVNSAGKYAQLPLGASGTYLRSNGTDLLSSNIPDGDLPTTQAGKTFTSPTINGGTVNSATIGGATISGGALNSTTLNGTTAVTGTTNVSGTTTFTNNVTIDGSKLSITGAPAFNGANIFGITGGSGGISNAGSTSIISDNDANGSGRTSLQTRNIERLGIENDGTVTFAGQFDLAGQSAPAVSGTGFARLYYDSTSHTVKISTEGGAFANLSTNQAATVLRYDAQRDFGISGSDQQTTGSIIGGTATLTLVNARDFINGDGILIAGAGTSGHNCINTVQSGGGTTSITLASNCPTTVSGAAVKHDDSAAFNSMLSTVVSNGGGNILLKATDRNGVRGKYHVAGPLQSNCNSIICFPQINRTSNPVFIGLIGEYGPPITGAGAVPTNGTVIDGSDFNDSTPSNFGAIISGKTYASTFTLTDTTFNWVQINLQNLLFRNKPNPALASVQMNNTESLLVQNVFIDNGEAETFTSASGFTVLTQPTNTNAAGLIMPGLNNIGQQYIQNVAVIGHYVGAVFGENSHVQQMYLIQNYKGARLHGNPALNTWYGGGIYEAETPIEATTDIYPQSEIDFHIQIEAYTGTGNWWDTPSGHRIYDPSNALAGKLVAQSDASAALPGITGGQLLNYEGIDANDGFYSISGSSSRLNITQTAAGSPTIAGQYTATNNLGDRAYFAAFGSSYGVSALQRNAILGADRKLYLTTGTGFDIVMQPGNTDKFQFTANNVLQMLTDNGGAVPNYSISRNANLMTLEGGPAGIAVYNSNGNNINYILDDSGNYTTLNAGGFSFVSGGTPFGGTADTRLSRNGAGVAAIDNGSSCSTPSNCRDLTARHLLANGTAPSIGSGFGTSPTIAGRDEAFRVTVGISPGSSGVVTFGTTFATAPICHATDETTATVIFNATPTTTQVTINVASGTLLASDKIGVMCRGFN